MQTYGQLDYYRANLVNRNRHAHMHITRPLLLPSVFLEKIGLADRGYLECRIDQKSVFCKLSYLENTTFLKCLVNPGIWRGWFVKKNWSTILTKRLLFSNNSRLVRTVSISSASLHSTCLKHQPRPRALIYRQQRWFEPNKPLHCAS